MQTPVESITREPRNFPFQIRLANQPVVPVNIDPHAASRRVNGWVGNEVSYMMRSGTPELVIDPTDLLTTVFWRVPVLLTSSKIGTVGEVGSVDVNAQTGELLTSQSLIDVLTANATRLVGHNAEAPTPPAA